MSLVDRDVSYTSRYYTVKLDADKSEKKFRDFNEAHSACHLYHQIMSSSNFISLFIR